MCLRRELTDLTSELLIISEMQHKLHMGSHRSVLRIQRLLRLITQPEWLAEAARITLSSKGPYPGVDGVNKTMLARPGC